MITKSFQTSVSNQFKASRQIFHKTLGAKLFYGFFIGLPVLLVVLKLISGKGLSGLEFGIVPTWVLALLLLSYPILFTPLTQYLQIRKAFQSNPSAQQRQNYEISESGIRNFGEGFNVEMSWDSIPKVLLSKDFLLMFISKNCAYYLPKDLVSDEEYMQIKRWEKLTKPAN